MMRHDRKKHLKHERNTKDMTVRQTRLQSHSLRVNERSFSRTIMAELQHLMIQEDKTEIVATI